jgi:hypothetical protein
LLYSQVYPQVSNGPALSYQFRGVSPNRILDKAKLAERGYSRRDKVASRVAVSTLGVMVYGEGWTGAAGCCNELIIAVAQSSGFQVWSVGRCGAAAGLARGRWVSMLALACWMTAHDSPHFYWSTSSVNPARFPTAC